MVELVGMVEVVGVARVVEVMRVVEVVRAVKVVRLVEVVRVVEVVYRCEENLGVKGPMNKKDVGLRMTMPQAAGKNKEEKVISNVDYEIEFAARFVFH